jgi:arylsulfatase
LSTRALLKLLAMAGCILLTALVAPGFAQVESDRPPNLLIVTIDTLRADHVGAYGYAKAKTHAIDQIAGIGVRFANALTPFPRTTPALASLFTGLWTQHHGSRNVGIPIKHGITLTEVLNKQGYQTHAVTSTALASMKQGFDRGFENFDGRSHDSEALLATHVTDRALNFARAASKDQPQMIWAHYFDPHFPYEPPPGFPNQPVAPSCRQLIEDINSHPDIEWNLHSNWGSVAERTRDDCVELYDAVIHYTDTEIARLLAGLNQIGFLNSVVIVITADHGESFGESGTYYEHGATVSEAVVRIPLVIAGPQINAGVEDALFSLEDLMPTLLGLLGVAQDARPAMDGRDFSSSLRKGSEFAPAENSLFAESANVSKPPTFVLPFDAAALRRLCQPGKALPECGKFGGAGELLAAIMGLNAQKLELPTIPSVKYVRPAIEERFRKGEARQRSVRSRDYKLVQAPRIDGGVQRALFDLKRDPTETTDVSALKPEVMQRLSAELDRWLESLPKYEREDLDEEDLEALRALGYIE